MIREKESLIVVAEDENGDRVIYVVEVKSKDYQLKSILKYLLQQKKF